MKNKAKSGEKTRAKGRAVSVRCGRWLGFFTSEPRRKYVDARLTIKGVDYDATLKLEKVHKAQRHLVQQGAWLRISKRGTITIRRLPRFTKKDAARIARNVKKLQALFDEPNRH